MSLVVWVEVCGYLGVGRKKFDLMGGRQNQSLEARGLRSLALQKSTQNLTLKRSVKHKIRGYLKSRF